MKKSILSLVIITLISFKSFGQVHGSIDEYPPTNKLIDTITVLGGELESQKQDIITYPYLLGKLFDCEIKNISRNGIMLQEADQEGEYSISAHYNDIPKYHGRSQYMIVNIGLRDIMAEENSTYNKTNFKRKYEELLNNLLSKKWDTLRVIVVPPPYIEKYNSNSNYQKHIEYIKIIKDLCDERHIKFVRLHGVTMATKTTALNVDGISYTQKGHEIIKQEVSNFILNLHSAL